MNGSPVTNLPDWQAYTNWDSYRTTWTRLNRPFLTQTMVRLPRLRVDKPLVHLPGIGPGSELLELQPYYPNATLVSSDITPSVLPDLRAVHDKLDLTPRILLEDAARPAVRNTDLCLSLFMLHLLPDPTSTLEALWDTLRPGGWLATVYFPPIPSGDGPLVAFFQAVSDVLGGKSKPNWEHETMPWLMSRASRLTSRALYAQWSFEDPGHFREAMELLPHIQTLRGKIGDARYDEAWARWNDHPGLLADHAEGWHGAVVARFVLAQKPMKGKP